MPLPQQVKPEKCERKKLKEFSAPKKQPEIKDGANVIK